MKKPSPVRQVGASWHAYDNNDKLLGTFPSRKQARAARRAYLNIHAVKKQADDRVAENK